MSHKGDYWDNAPTESLWERLSMDEVRDWLAFQNHRRLQLDYLTREQLQAAQLPPHVPTNKKPIRKPAHW